MKTFQGKTVYNEIAIGKLFLYKRTENKVKRYHIENIDSEIERFNNAKKMAHDQLEELYQKALVEIGETNALIFNIHQMMLEDADFSQSVENIISTQMINAESAVALTSQNLSTMFSMMEDAYMKERASDIKDISERVISNLSENERKNSLITEPVILVADDLAPSETMQLDKSKILAFVTENGAITSHTAILARTMNIPALICVKGILKEAVDGKEAIVDGFSGTLFIEPDTNTKNMFLDKKEERENQKRLLKKLKGVKTKTSDEQEIKLYANISSVGDVGAALQNDAEGIGLFRSEFLYLQEKDYPSEDMQFEAYRSVAEAMAGKKVIIRTFDIGADKKVDYFNIPPEENPALGFRAVRMYIKRPDIIKTQLRAILRASAYGNLAIMIPMITSQVEVLKVKEMLEVAKNELKSEKIPFTEDIDFGIMIETPAAALISDILAPLVNFFSIGTNDLTQYTIAFDRQNDNVSDLYHPEHFAVLRLIKYVCDNARKENIWVGVCGEAASDLSLTEDLIGLGVSELSTTPSMILPLRDKILKSDFSECRRIVLDRIEPVN